MFIPVWVLGLVGAGALIFVVWALFAVNGRNLLPFPDPGSRIFAARSVEAQRAVVDLLARHGLAQRSWGVTPGVRRAILWDWTIISVPKPEVLAKVGQAACSIGLVVDDPQRRATEAAEFLRSRGFQATVVLDAEPELPIAFVITDAMVGTAFNFRKHAVKMPMPQPLDFGG
ncbi:MAG: hypothetical protein Q8S33_00005 [Myxococcales bacterium]|nr:hypothetical protein [Myxococcales bacterium]MDP3498674.1 hypothetical protein [Myxococcales bacterium]